MSWAKALQSNNVTIFNPSITQDGRLYYYPTNNQTNSIAETLSGRPCSLSNQPCKPIESTNLSKPTVELNTSDYKHKPHDVYISQSFNQRDYTDRDNNYEIQSALRYYSNNNVFPTVDDVNQVDSIKVSTLNEFNKPNSSNLTKEIKPNSTEFNQIRTTKGNKTESFQSISQSNTNTSNNSDDLIEGFIKIPMNDTQYDIVDELYKELLRSYTYSILNFVLNFESYKPWIRHWKWLEKNIYKNDLKIYKLSEEHQQVAYNYNKCQHMNFRWKDNKGYISKNVFAYVLLHELAHASFPPEFKQHKYPFNDILCLLTVAAIELDLINLTKLPTTEYVSNNTPILSKSSFLAEVRHGIELLIESNDDKSIVEYYYDRLKLLDNY